jgi:exopolyphosphatase/guanosine-5'-triphosphate,3'-diphosphate pyrophosphatase
MDIGGGSTEFISFQQGEVTGVTSSDIGVTRILKTFDLHNTLSSEDITLLKDFFKKQCGLVNVSQPSLIGASGAFETFYKLLNSKELPRHQLVNLSLDQLTPLIEKLVSSTEIERMQMDHVPEFRKKYLHIAALQVQWVIETFEIHEVWVTSAGLCEGVMIQYLTLNER